MQADFVLSRFNHFHDRSRRKRTSTKEDICLRLRLIQPLEHGFEFGEVSEPINFGKVKI